jgi:hypothetical protein
MLHQLSSGESALFRGLRRQARPVIPVGAVKADPTASPALYGPHHGWRRDRGVLGALEAAR